MALRQRVCGGWLFACRRCHRMLHWPPMPPPSLAPGEREWGGTRAALALAGGRRAGAGVSSAPAVDATAVACPGPVGAGRDTAARPLAIQIHPFACRATALPQNKYTRFQPSTVASRRQTLFQKTTSLIEERLYCRGRPTRHAWSSFRFDGPVGFLSGTAVQSLGCLG